MALFAQPRARSSKTVKQIMKERAVARRGGIREMGPSGAVVKAGFAIFRRLAKKIPGVKKFIPGSAPRIARAEARLRAVGGLAGGRSGSFGRFTRPRPVNTRRSMIASRPVKAATKLVVAGAALEAGSRALQAIIPSPVVTVRPEAVLQTVFGGGTQTMAHPGIGAGGGGGLQLGGTAPPGNVIVKVWDTGTARFARDASGMHYVLKKDGTVKRFRPPRPVCIPKKWDSRSMSRVMRRLGSHQNAAIKLVKMMGGSASKTRHAHR